MLYNINPKKWGKSYWEMSHYLTLAYPDMPTNHDKLIVKTHFENLKYLLPCENCRSHYSEYMSIYPLTDDILNSRYKLIKWLIDLHNSVNKRLGKKEYQINEIISMYLSDNNNIINYELLQLIFLIIIVVCLIIYVKNKSE